MIALLGAEKAFPEPLHVGRPNLGDTARFMERMQAILDSKWLTNHGAYLREFESRIAELTGTRHCIAVANATSGLEMVARALGMSGEVIVPAMTFVATAHALQWQGITPVFCDVDPDTHNIDAAQAERLVTSRTTGILAVHLWGRPCDVEALRDLAGRRRLKLAYDAAHATGCRYGEKMIGGFGDAEVFSFHATKVVNSFEGGAITTNDGDLAERLRLMQNFGFRGYDNVVALGTNGKMCEAAAAMGLTTLESLGDFVEHNRNNYLGYVAGLAQTPGLKTLSYLEENAPNYHYVVVEVDGPTFGLTRDELVAALHADNILARRYFYPGCHRMEPYRTLYPEAGTRLTETENLCRNVMVLPTGTAVSTQDVARICAVITAAGRHAAKVRARLAAVGGGEGAA